MVDFFLCVFELSPEERIEFCNQNTQLLLITPRNESSKKKQTAEMVEEQIDLPQPKEEEFQDLKPVGNSHIVFS